MEDTSPQLDVTFVMRAKHADLWAAIKKLGGARQLAALLGVSRGLVYHWASLWSTPNLDTPQRNSPFADPVFVAEFERKLFELTGKTLDELWPPELRRATAFLRSDKVFEVTKTYTAEALTYSGGEARRRLVLADPAATAGQHELANDIREVVSTLPPRECQIITLRFGLGDSPAMTLDDVADIVGVTRERIRQIEAKAVRKLQQPSRSGALTGHLE